jgi:hypothetical protein
MKRTPTWKEKEQYTVTTIPLLCVYVFFAVRHYIHNVSEEILQ